MRGLTDQFIELKERLPASYLLTFFAITVMLDLHTATDLVLNMITELQKTFPGSVHLRAQRAMVYYHMRCECHVMPACQTVEFCVNRVSSL